MPRREGHVGIYVCGPTVYGRIHVGNARPYVVFSLLKRYLVREGFEVSFVANITDINDKIYAAALASGVGSEQLARQMAEAYRTDTDGLGLGRPDHEPLASETIPGIVGLIERLIERGHAYAADGDVYFSVRSYPDYGQISHRKVDDMDQGEGLEGDGRKRDPLEFDADRLTEAEARVARIREAGRRLVAGPSPEWSAPLKERFLAALAEDFNTPGALAAVFDWVRQANRAEEGVGDADLREMLE